LDLGCWSQGDGVPFTHSSNLVAALGAALDRGSWEQKFTRIATTAAALRVALRDCGFSLVATDADASPGMVTIALPSHRSSRSFGWHLEKLGYLVSHRSEYLLRRNWIQIALFGDFDSGRLEDLLREMTSLIISTHTHNASSHRDIEQQG
jgi:aspartate aminotransferase-like enzyme